MAQAKTKTKVKALSQAVPCARESMERASSVSRRTKTERSVTALPCCRIQTVEGLVVLGSQTCHVIHYLRNTVAGNIREARYLEAFRSWT